MLRLSAGETFVTGYRITVLTAVDSRKFEQGREGRFGKRFVGLEAMRQVAELRGSVEHIPRRSIDSR